MIKIFIIFLIKLIGFLILNWSFLALLRLLKLLMKKVLLFCCIALMVGIVLLSWLPWLNYSYVLFTELLKVLSSFFLLPSFFFSLSSSFPLLSSFFFLPSFFFLSPSSFLFLLPPSSSFFLLPPFLFLLPPSSSFFLAPLLLPPSSFFLVVSPFLFLPCSLFLPLSPSSLPPFPSLLLSFFFFCFL